MSLQPYIQVREYSIYGIYRDDESIIKIIYSELAKDRVRQSELAKDKVEQLKVSDSLKEAWKRI